MTGRAPTDAERQVLLLALSSTDPRAFPGAAEPLAGSVDFAGPEGGLLLWRAVAHGRNAAARWLLDHGAPATFVHPGGGDLESRHAAGLQPIHVAKSAAMVTLLRERGADARVESARGVTPLHVAAHSGQAEVMEALLAAGAEPDVEDADGNTPLLNACANIVRFNRAAASYEAGVRRLLELGARVNVSGTNGLTPLIQVRDDLVPLLLEHGADACARSTLGMTALHNVGSGASARALLARGADVGARVADTDPYAAGHTPLHSAADPQVIALLVQHGADVNAREARGRTALHIQAEVRGRATQVRILLKDGADVDAQDHAGNTPLHHVADTSVKALLAAKPDLTLRNAAGRAPLFEALHWWARLEAWEKVALKSIAAFFAAGQDPMMRDASGQNLLHHVARLARRRELVEVLLRHGVDKDAADAAGATPLHVWAAEGRKPDVGQALLAAGARTDLADAQGQTAAHVVARRTPAFRKVLKP
jgi:ankyrin repeat protein